MASSGNFCTWNPLNVGSGGSTSLTVGNTNAVMTGADPRTTGTLGGTISDSDGYYFETVATSIGDGALTLGIVNEDRNSSCMYEQIHSRSGSFMWRPYSSGQFFVETSTNSSYGTFANGDVIGWYVKNSKLYVKKNNSDVVGDVAAGSGGIDISGNFFFPAVSRTVGGGSQTTAVLRPDSDSWSYTPPSGFKGLTSKDINISDDIDPAQTDDDYPGKQFNAVLWTGDGSNNRSVSGVGFKPDLLWGKVRSSSDENFLYDSNRGSNRLLPSTSDAQADYSAYWSQFDSDGWTFGNNASSQNISSGTFVGWCWKANGGTTASNTDGTITSTVQANTKAGFSIITFTSPSSSADQTVGHGLSAAPDFVIAKKLNSSANWNIFHRDLSANQGLRFTTALPISNAWGSMSATTIGVKSPYSYASGDNYVHYAWHSVEGYSKFSKYTGNGSADGPFIYTGFRPRMLFIKQFSGSTANWNVFDTARDTHNYVSKHLTWDSDAQEYDGSSYSLDVLSNGFKIRASWGQINTSGSDCIFGAWGDVPAKYNNTF